VAWKASGAFYRDKRISGLVDYDRLEAMKKLYIPDDVSRLIPPKQLEHTLRYYGAYAEAIDNLCWIVNAIQCIGEAEKTVDQSVYLHCYTEMADYFTLADMTERTLCSVCSVHQYSQTERYAKK